MTGADRRQKIIKTIEQARKPVPAKDLAATYEVSRQVIVQDIALIRAAGYEILSTNRGYILAKPGKVTRVFKVSHTDKQIEDELNAIVDLGAEVVNVMVHHKVYGTMEAPLHVTSRKTVHQFMDDINSGKSSPLKNITSNYHYHTVSADSEKTLKEVEEVLDRKGYLIRTEI